MKTRLTERLGIRLPVLQGGLAYLARAELAAAVSQAGGLGQITATTLDGPQALAREIASVRQRTDAPFGVNFALGRRPVDDLLEVALEAQVPVVTLTGGNPAPYVERLQAAGVPWMTLVGSVRAARKAAELGALAVIAVGFEAGGHIGRDDVTTLVLTRAICQAVTIPVVASGGFVDGYGLLAALALGAEGVEMGTRFVATQESPAHPAYKRRLVESEITSTAVVERSLGRPGRVLASPTAQAIAEAEATGDEARLLQLIRGEVNRRAALEGDLDGGFVWAGQAAGLIRDLPSAAELLSRMMQEFEAALGRIQEIWEG
ncbi:MAG: nitronate monooxygenase [Firmicutes bacterium]|nr:nitronate monooxygenase [Bacillota bacterium]